MKYKLLVLDVDGTLLNDAKEISKRTLASLLKAQQMGVRIALASGRPTYASCHWPKLLSWGIMGALLFPITVVRLSMLKTEKSCSRGESTRKCCLIWKRRRAMKWLRHIHLS